MKRIIYSILLVMYGAVFIGNATEKPIVTSDRYVKSDIKYQIDEELDKYKELTYKILNKQISLDSLDRNALGIHFTSDMGKKFNNTDTLNLFYNSKIIENESYYIIPENTTSKDKVIVVDMKVQNSVGNEFLLLFEYHINKDNVVYGINVWVY